MKTLRGWQLSSTDPHALQIAADARFSQTDYTNDQIWELLLGEGDSPALVLQTRYGGRVGLASIAPMWWLDGRSVYQADAYAREPVVTAFAPGYIRIQAAFTTDLSLFADYVVFDSQSIGIRYTLANAGSQPITVKLDLFGQVGVAQKSLPLAILTLVDQSHALSLGRIQGLEPVVVMDDAFADLVPGQRASPKIGVEHKIEPGGEISIRWVHAGLAAMRDSVRKAQSLLAEDWNSHVEQIDLASQAIPRIQTGNTEYDAAIAFSYQYLMQAAMAPTSSLPHTSFVAARQPAHGYSRQGDGNDYDRSWNGQNPHLAYLCALAYAPIAPPTAQGIIRNYLAVQASDGAIDFKPGLGGQRQGFLCPPLLARLAWNIYQYTEDLGFLKEVYPPLLKFFNRWSEEDLDADGDELPEWQDERQTGYVFWPTFGTGQPWAANVDIRHVETPDMAAYLLSEAISLREIAHKLQDPGAYELQSRVVDLQNRLERMWNNDLQRYAYRDHQSHITSKPVTLLKDGRGDEEHLIAAELDPVSRVVIHVTGGTTRPPRAVALIEGEDAGGKAISETVDFEQFTWSYGNGLYATQHVYRLVKRLRFTGLSRVFRVSVSTVDLTRLDINALMPLWALEIPPERVETLINLLLDESLFWRPTGVSIIPASDSNYDPSSARGGGGVWPFWTTLMGEALLAHGRGKQASQLLGRLLDVQALVLKSQKGFSEFYDAESPAGRGEARYLGGIVPLHLLMAVLGVKVVNAGRVWTGGPYLWRDPVTIQQYGMTIYRSHEGTTVSFASGHRVELGPDAEWQPVNDSSPGAEIEPVPDVVEHPPKDQDSPETGRVIIDIEDDQNDESLPDSQP